ncbi:unnamed protein product [Miscanthus lutarioriparius]|uniref:Thaumatin-like protein n=1 Tax=Miscanthus lutarioriparius TaxID=422564 RepID=A0A811QY99_9POAL|nr:unnamed protein product [Miscanthus lutarioriparius]
MATTTRAACRALFTFLVVLGARASASDDFAPSTDVDTKTTAPTGWRRFTPAELKGYEYVLGIPMPHGWSGRIWGRTDCSTDGNGKFTCATGDCGSGRLECDGGGGGGPAPAATVAEFALGVKGGTDTYDISLADGYNLPMLVAPYDTSHGGGQPLGNAGSLQNACPTAKSYAVVDAASASTSFSCAVVNNTYTVTFCPDNSEFDPKYYY